MKMKIFFLHSRQDYKTEQEKLWLDNIRKHYPDALIINSSDVNDKIEDSDKIKGMKYIEEKYFFPIIDVSDIMIVTPRNESGRIGSERIGSRRFTVGVVVEMKYAWLKGKKIKIIEGEIKEIDKRDIEKYENDIVYEVPGDEPVRIKDLMRSKGFSYDSIIIN